MFITALVFMTGILSYFNDNNILWAVIFSVISIIFLIKNYVSFKYIFLWLFIFYIGFFNAYFRVHNTDGLVPFANNKLTLEGQIVSIPNSGTQEKTKFFFKVNKANDSNVRGKTLVTINSDDKDFSQFQVGDFYKIEGSLKTPFKAGNPSQFDYGKYLRNFDTFTVFYTDKENCVRLERELNLKWRFLRKLNILRGRILNVHSKYMKSPNIEILGGIVFGDDAVAPPDYIKASFVNSGLLHILAASGMNVAFIYGFWVFFMKRLRVPFKISVISGMGLIILYTFMTGLGASVIRAALMLLFVLLGKLIDRDANSVALLAFVAMIMLIYNPAFINDVGFQLSFIVTFGLLTTANIILENYKDSKIRNFLIGAVVIPVVAQIWVAPIQMFYFNTFSTYSVLANICTMPFLSVVSFGGFLSSIFAMYPYFDRICYALDFIMNYFLNVIVYISNYFASLNSSLLTTTHPSVFQILIYYGIVLLATLLLKTGLSKKIIAGCCVLFILLVSSTVSLPSNSLEIITFDVQNADCFLIKTPQNKYFIIDTGRAAFNGGKAQANSIIIKYLKDKGIKNIEGMIVTHFDNDHSGGASDIMKTVKVKNVYINSYSDKTMTSVNIFKTIRENKINSQIPKGIIYSEPDLKINTYIADKKEDNDKSIITLLKYKDFDMIFMGDAGVGAFAELKQSIPQNIEVLKVGHHGGFNVVNSSMLEHLKTKVSVISVGPNAFGHPNRATLDILRNTDIYRTDRHNSVKIISDGNKYSVLLFNPQLNKYEVSKKYSIN